MGSSFVDLDATNSVMKTDFDLDVPFRNYIVFSNQIKNKKREKKSQTSMHDSTRAAWDDVLIMLPFLANIDWVMLMHVIHRSMAS